MKGTVCSIHSIDSLSPSLPQYRVQSLSSPRAIALLSRSLSSPGMGFAENFRISSRSGLPEGTSRRSRITISRSASQQQLLIFRCSQRVWTGSSPSIPVVIFISQIWLTFMLILILLRRLSFRLFTTVNSTPSHSASAKSDIPGFAPTASTV